MKKNESARGWKTTDRRKDGGKRGKRIMDERKEERVRGGERKRGR